MSDVSEVSRGMSRRDVLKRAGFGGALVAAALVSPGLVGVAAADSRRRRLRIKVVDAVFTDNGLVPDNFVVVGDIVMVDGHHASGKFYCKGVALGAGEGGPGPDAGTFVDQQFHIDGVGSIMGAGSEVSAEPAIGFDDLAVVGGTGEFSGAEGEYGAVDGGPIPFTADGTIVYEFRFGDGDDD